MKRVWEGFVVLLLCITLTGCNLVDSKGSNQDGAKQEGNSSSSDEPIHLTICMDGRTSNDTGGQLLFFTQDLVEYYNNVVAPSKVNITIETLSNKEEERKNQIKKIQTEIMSGGGPDIFLLDVGQDHYLADHLLFKDINKSMHTGVFADISEYIEQDSNIDYDDFYPVMKAGEVDGKQYILPITMTYATTFLTDSELGSVIDVGNLTGTSVSYLNELTKQQGAPNPSITAQQIPAFALLDNPIDYENETVKVTTEQLEELIKSYTGNIKAKFINDMKGQEEGLATTIIVSDEYSVGNYRTEVEGFNIYSLMKIAASKATDKAYTEYPVPTINGTFNVCATNAAAINTNCEYQQEAFEFVKLFLNNEIQSGMGLSDKKGIKQYADFYSMLNDWPVRKDLDLEFYWKKSGIFSEEYPLSNDDFAPAIKADSAYFSSYLDTMFEQICYNLALSQELEKEVSDEDIAAAAENFMKELKVHASE